MRKDSLEEEHSGPADMDRQILVSVLSGKASAAEIEKFEEWRSADPGNEAAYRRYATVWRMVGKLDPTQPVIRDSPVATETRDATRRTAGLPRAEAYLLAASIVVGLGLGTFFSVRSLNPPFGAEEIASGAEAVTVSLVDGTVVRLAPDSRLSVRADDPPRSVFLTGQGFFAVPSGATEPFRVFVEGGEFIVHGTRFAVQAADSALQVVVVEGVVEIDAAGESLTVGPNEVGRAGGSEGARVEQVDDVFSQIGWMGDFVVFESTPLQDVATEMDRRFGLRVDIQDAELSARTVTGSFQDQEPLQILTGICLAVDAQCTVEDGLVLVSPQPTAQSR